MTEHRCQCGQPAPDATICRSCVDRLRHDLRALFDRRHGTSYADDLDIALTRQARFSDRGDGSRSTSLPLVFAYVPSEVRDVLRSTLVGWVRVLDEAGDYWPANTIDAMARWLHRRVRDLAQHEAGDQAVAEITYAVGQVRSAVDRPPELVYAGPCLTPLDGADEATTATECHADVYARPGRPWASCRRCGASHNVAERREQMAEALEEREVTATRAVTYLRMLGFATAASTIRTYAHRQQLAAVDHTVRGAVYRLGDILDILRDREQIGQAS